MSLIFKCFYTSNDLFERFSVQKKRLVNMSNLSECQNLGTAIAAGSTQIRCHPCTQSKEQLDLSWAGHKQSSSISFRNPSCPEHLLPHLSRLVHHMADCMSKTRLYCRKAPIQYSFTVVSIEYKTSKSDGSGSLFPEASAPFTNLL